MINSEAKNVRQTFVSQNQQNMPNFNVKYEKEPYVKEFLPPIPRQKIRCNCADGGQNLPPPGWNKVKVSESLGAIMVTLVAPVDTSLLGQP